MFVLNSIFAIINGCVHWKFQICNDFKGFVCFRLIILMSVRFPFIWDSIFEMILFTLDSIFLDTQVSRRPTHVGLSVGDTFEFPLPLKT